jgi:hypothetical protein
MNVSVTGPKGGKLPLELRAYTTMAVKDFAKQLGIQRLHTNINVRVHNHLVIDKVVEGYCEPESKRNFNIDVCLFGNWLSTLAHEMVHVKQFARGELSLDMKTWKNKKDCDNIEYWDQPWEKEARRLQHKLVEDFCK